MFIEGPSRDIMEVSSEGMGKVRAIAVSPGHHFNHTHEESYSIIVSKTPTGAGDCFLYLKNTDDDDIIVNSITLYAASDESVQIKLGDSGTTAGGSANTPVNRNTGTGNTAECDCEDGVDITGLSGGSVVEDIFIDGATSAKKYRWDSSLILKKNGVLTLYAVTGAIAIKATLSISFHSCS